MSSRRARQSIAHLNQIFLYARVLMISIVVSIAHSLPMSMFAIYNLTFRMYVNKAQPILCSFVDLIFGGNEGVGGAGFATTCTVRALTVSRWYVYVTVKTPLLVGIPVRWDEVNGWTIRTAD